MFTGIIEELATIKSVQKLDQSQSGGNGYAIIVACSDGYLDQVKLGDSIAVNGVCLTATEFTQKSSVKFQVAPETLRKTNLGLLKEGDKVNIERSMKAGERFDGHMVQAHVDTTIEIVDVKPDPPNSVIYTFKVPEPSDKTGNVDFSMYIVPKGYVCLDGTSLTVISTDQSARTFTVMLIKYTQEKVVMTLKNVGSAVNLEVDQVGKYIHSIVTSMLFGGKQIESSGAGSLLENMINKIVDEKLDRLK